MQEQGSKNNGETISQQVKGAFGEIVLFFRGKQASGEEIKSPTSRQILDRLRRRN